MEATTLNILVDYTGCESEKDRAEVRVTARHKARLQMATHPELLKALDYVRLNNQFVLDAHVMGDDERAFIQAMQNKVVAAIALAKPRKGRPCLKKNLMIK